MRSRIHLGSAACIMAAMLLGGLLTASVQAEAILVGYWNLDEGSGTTAADSATPPASDGTLAASPNTPTWTTGYLNGGLSFDGTSNGDRVSMPDTDELDLTGDLTLDFWMKPLGLGVQKYGPLVGKNVSGGQANDAYFVDIYYTSPGVSGTGSVIYGTGAPGVLEFGITNGSVNTVLRSATALSTSTSNTEWYHVRCEYVAGERMTIYINDVEDAELTTGVPASCASVPFGVGLGNLAPGSTTYGYAYKGVLDEVRIYNGVVPEPGCLALLAGGLLGLALGRRRNG
ncbi:MAG TPA: LamG-like jellyroll fold domain-containing protein [Thermoguttaceae bacterium]|nr:LamG-like jellyroll fold domain-containing protein [Thermoguttaceae bacterium]